MEKTAMQQLIERLNQNIRICPDPQMKSRYVDAKFLAEHMLAIEKKQHEISFNDMQHKTFEQYYSQTFEK